MALNITYRLSNPNYTVYHRASLGGLAATIIAWGENLPNNIQAKVEKDRVWLASDDEISEQEAVRRILEASFQLTEDKLIHFPGQFLDDNAADLRVAVHEGLCLTFLQHNKMRPGTEVRKVELKRADDETGTFLSYKTIDRYAHQNAQRTGLLDEKSKDKNVGQLAEIATIRQFAVPGAVAELEAKSEEIL